MTYLVFLEDEAELQIQSLQSEFARYPGLQARFYRALANIFSTLETFPNAFPVIVQRDELEIRRALVKGFTKGLLYTVLDDVQEVRVLCIYDLRSQESTPVKPVFQTNAHRANTVCPTPRARQSQIS
jgi:hypothetical protein